MSPVLKQIHDIANLNCFQLLIIPYFEIYYNFFKITNKNIGQGCYKWEFVKRVLYYFVTL